MGSLGELFGIEPLITTPLAVVSDARIGSRTDKSVIVERLLTISGQDQIAIHRKFRQAWNGCLSTRIGIMTNELSSLGSTKLEEREEISRGIAVGRSIQQIAQGLGRAPSTVSREIKRNGGSQAYRANRADRRAWEQALRPKPCRLALHGELRWRVAQKLALQWSPEQISGWLEQEIFFEDIAIVAKRPDLAVVAFWI